MNVEYFIKLAKTWKLPDDGTYVPPTIIFTKSGKSYLFRIPEKILDKSKIMVNNKEVYLYSIIKPENKPIYYLYGKDDKGNMVIIKLNEKKMEEFRKKFNEFVELLKEIGYEIKARPEDVYDLLESPLEKEEIYRVFVKSLEESGIYPTHIIRLLSIKGEIKNIIYKKELKEKIKTIEEKKIIELFKEILTKYLLEKLNIRDITKKIEKKFKESQILMDKYTGKKFERSVYQNLKDIIYDLSISITNDNPIEEIKYLKVEKRPILIDPEEPTKITTADEIIKYISPTVGTITTLEYDGKDFYIITYDSMKEIRWKKSIKKGEMVI